jgi:hypothetical protein
MKYWFLLPAALLSFAFTNPHYFSSVSRLSIKIDSTVIEHKLDGAINEWPVNKFSSDKETDIQYAIDNDAQNLYLVMKITDQGEQMKLMRMGMKLFIDLKGKHKENLGVEFPLKKIDGSGFSGGATPQSNGQRNEQEGKPDLKRMRMMLALNLFSMNLFGFTEGDPVEQNLEIQGSVRIAYDWDSTDVMHLEYLVPLKMLGDISSLNQKIISIGWKINGMEMPSGSGNFSGPPGGGRPPGGRPPGGGGGGRPGGGSGQVDMGKMMKEQEIWTRYTFLIPTALKGF